MCVHKRAVNLAYTKLKLFYCPDLVYLSDRDNNKFKFLRGGSLHERHAREGKFFVFSMHRASNLETQDWPHCKDERPHPTADYDCHLLPLPPVFNVDCGAAEQATAGNMTNTSSTISTLICGGKG